MSGQGPIPSLGRSKGTQRPAEGGPTTSVAFAEDRPSGILAMLRLLDSSRRAVDVDPDEAEPGASSSHLPDDPAEIAAAILFGRTIERDPAILDRIRERSPVLIVDCPDDSWLEPMTNVLVRGFGSGSTLWKRTPGMQRSAGQAVVVKGRSDDVRIRAETPGVDVGRAFRNFQALICVAAPGRSRLPFEVERSWEERIPLGPLEPDDLTMIAARIVGSDPKTTVPASIAARVDATDLRIALHASRGADGSIDRLRAIVERRVSKPPAAPTPRLSHLSGYGAAAEWGIAAAADLAAFGRGELPWADCEPGALLSGPPGVGKTIFASALAREADVPFIAGSLAQWQAEGEAHLGTTLKAMIGFFREARKMAPCVALVDELDSFGDRRKLADYNRSYGVQVINGFLECLDGDGGRAGVLMIGATNDATQIDPAILRAGRFDRVIAIARPALEELPAILRHHLGSDLVASDLRPIARKALGGTGADCAAWVRRARGRARRAGRPLVENDILVEIAGSAGRARVEDERRVAIHECGHAVAARSLGLSIGDLVLRSPGHGGGGYMGFAPPGVVTRHVLRNMLIVLMAGRAAEILAFGDPSAGAEADLLAATTLARDMHVRWGLDRRLSADGGRMVDPAVGTLVERALRSAAKSALALLGTRRERLLELAEMLESRRSLASVEVEEFLR